MTTDERGRCAVATLAWPMTKKQHAKKTVVGRVMIEPLLMILFHWELEKQFHNVVSWNRGSRNQLVDHFAAELRQLLEQSAVKIVEVVVVETE